MWLPKIQRDPEVSNLVFSIQQRLLNIVEPFETKEVIQQNTIRFVSFEEALKELVSLKKQKNL